MKPLWTVFVLIWYICVNENYLFTRAGNKYFISTFEYGLNSTISCKQSVINIEKVIIKDSETTCQLSKQCDVTEDMINNIKTGCDGLSSCIPTIQLLPTCLTDIRYFNITFVCSVRNMACNFEKSIETGHWILSEGWQRRNGSDSVNRTLPQIDATTVSDYGHYLYTEGHVVSTLKSERILTRGEWKCLTFWYNAYSSNSVLNVYQMSENRREKSWNFKESETNWIQERINLEALRVYNIVFQALPGTDEYIALDEIGLYHGPCNDLIVSSNPKTNFEKDLGGWEIDASNSDGWIRQKAENLNSKLQPSTDYTTATCHGYYLSLQRNGTGVLKSPKLTATNKCLTFWYYIKGNGIAIIRVKQKIEADNKELVKINKSLEDKWTKTDLTVTTTVPFIIALEGTLNGSNGFIAVDDISITDGDCLGDEFHEQMCVDTTDQYTIACSAQNFYYENINVKLDPVFDDSDDKCVETEKEIQQQINEVCFKNETCVFKPSHVISQDRKQCSKFNRTVDVHVYYSCRDEVTSMLNTISVRPETEETTYNGNQAESSNHSLAIGVTVGVVLVILVAACLILGIIYLRRSRYLEKKAPSNVGNANNHIDYTGHQNIAFSPKVSGNTQTDYCEIRASKHNEQYHDISDTFSTLINTEKDVEYSEIANVVNSPNSNPNPSTNYQHQYITLDPNATGFDRSNPQTNLHNESKNNHNSNEKTSLTCGDDYAVLDPDHLNESKNITPNVLPLSDNYVVLDPNETGFNRQENTDRVCNYDLATPIVTSEDPYDVSKDETYDTSSNSRQKEKENNIYSHTVDNVYDTAGNQRKKEESDGTYDHFFGQKSEDDYDISKPI